MSENTDFCIRKSSKSPTSHTVFRKDARHILVSGNEIRHIFHFVREVGVIRQLGDPHQHVVLSQDSRDMNQVNLVGGKEL